MAQKDKISRRDLIKTGEAIYNTEGISRKIRYLHRDRRFINLDDPIPFYVAANGPKTLGLAGEFGPQQWKQDYFSDRV